jgi:CRP-like cAMP-binding protein
MIDAKNQLIQHVTGAARTHLLQACQPVRVEIGQVLWVQGDLVRYAYFPISAIISLITSLDGQPVLEVGMAGREGYLGVQLALGIRNAPLHAVVQGSGDTLRIEAAVLQREIARNPALHRVLDLYLGVRLNQLGTSVACLRMHSIEPRLARWLLMTHDRAGSDTFEITQQFLAYMLGVRRAGISAAAAVLQQRGLIRYHRGSIAVLDRTGLELAACSCYVTDRECYSATFG